MRKVKEFNKELNKGLDKRASVELIDDSIDSCNPVLESDILTNYTPKSKNKPKKSSWFSNDKKITRTRSKDRVWDAEVDHIYDYEMLENKRLALERVKRNNKLFDFCVGLIILVIIIVIIFMLLVLKHL